MLVFDKDSFEFILSHNMTSLNKIKGMHNMYVVKNIDNYRAEQQLNLNSAIEAVCHKCTLTIMHLEMLWKQSEQSRIEILTLYDNAINSHEWNDFEKTLGSLQLEAALFQARALLDIYHRYCIAILLGSSELIVSKNDFLNILGKIDGPYKQKAEQLIIYFEEVVYATKEKVSFDNLEPIGWGTVLKSMRDKIAHYDYLRYKYDGSEIVYDTVLNWPTLKGLTYERFCQTIENGIFCMLQACSAILYETVWVSR